MNAQNTTPPSDRSLGALLRGEATALTTWTADTVFPGATEKKFFLKHWLDRNDGAGKSPIGKGQLPGKFE